MRPWRLVAASCLLAAAPSAPARADDAPGGVSTTASPEPAARPPQRIGYGALPGGLHVASAETLPQGTVELGLTSGFGYRKGLLAGDHAFDRAIGQLAIGYAPLPGLSLALSLDGRYDKHTGTGVTDDGYVGDPHILARFAAPLGKVALGGQLGVWVPGKDAPSIAASAISVDGRALVSVDTGFATLSLDAGFRVDNSAKSVDQPSALSYPDRVSLGVSRFHAALAGAALRIPLGARAYVELEGSADVFVGSGAPGPIVRGGGVLGLAVNDTVSIIGYVEGAHVPGIRYGDVMAHAEIPLLPYEPAITGGLGVQARFGGKPAPAGAPQITVNPRPAPVTVIETADVTGQIVDDAGRPVVGARVTLTLKNVTGHAVSDDKGNYTIGKLQIGKTVDGKTELDDTGAELAVEVASKKPGSATLTLARGVNQVPRITLDPMLPPGQLRAVIRSAGTGRPIDSATVTIQPGDITQTTGADGKFTVDLPPGHYKITVTARGLAQQQLDVTIEQNGVAIKNIDMHR